MRLPDPRQLQAELRKRGFVLVSGLLDGCEQSAFFEVAVALTERHSAPVHRTDDQKNLWYDVVTGDRIEGSALSAFYTGPDMLSWVRALTESAALGPSPHLRSAININCLQATGQQYPWHRDAVPYTAVLFLSSVATECGGTLLIRAADGESVTVQPTAGDLIFMDGARCPHAVAPLTADTLRLTVPMVYPVHTTDRPAGLDEFLYGRR